MSDSRIIKKQRTTNKSNIPELNPSLSTTLTTSLTALSDKSEYKFSFQSLTDVVNQSDHHILFEYSDTPSTTSSWIVPASVRCGRPPVCFSYFHIKHLIFFYK